MSHDKSFWDRFQHAVNKKEDEKFIAEAEAEKERMPPEIRAILDLPGARVLPPSEVRQRPELMMVEENIRLKANLEDLNHHYRSALTMLHALVHTYGVDADGPGNKRTLYVSDFALKSAPDCITIEAVTDEKGTGHQIEASAHACENKAHPN